MTEQVEYRDADHTYWCRGRRYLSATQILDMFKNKFEGEKVAEQYKDKAGQSKEYWLKHWDDIREQSLVRGNTIHNNREEVTNHRGTDVWKGKPYRVQNLDRLSLEDPLRTWPDGIYTEKVLWHHGYGIAGKADKIILDTFEWFDTPKTTTAIFPPHRYMHIDDYKTNRILRTRSFDGKTMMKDPISHLEDCTMVHYALQLSLYQFMGEYLGFHPGYRTIIHFPHIPEMAPEGALPPPPKSYDMPYLKKEVISMLDYLKARRVL